MPVTRYALCALATLCQEPQVPEPAAPASDTAGDEELPRLEELQIEYYRPEHLDSQLLVSLASQFVGRLVEGRTLSGGTSHVANLRALDEWTVMVIDEPELVPKILDALRRLDRDPGTSEESASEDEAPIVTEDVQLRFLGYEELQPLLRNVDVKRLPALGSLRIRGDSRTVGELLELLAELDRPKPEVLLTLWILQVTSGDAPPGSSPPPPPELIEHLRRLLPDRRFSQLGTAWLRTTVRPGTGLMVRIQRHLHDDAFTVQLKPVAWDPASATLTVENLLLQLHGPKVRETLLTTAATLTSGEYTVIGATGGEPVLLVAQLTPLENAQPPPNAR